jgi:hypothetical protein
MKLRKSRCALIPATAMDAVLLLAAVFSAVVLPVVVAGVIASFNDRRRIKAHSNGCPVNVFLGRAFPYSLIVSYNAIAAAGQRGTD